jgi:prepilin signal peptidase PulO-like enzyme (type II secretory pathway)
MNLILGLFIFLFGASIGSFLNVLIDRLPQERKITGRSVCDYCQHQLAWYDLIPIFSFFLLKGHCRYCRKKISFQYPLVEILTGLMFIFVFLTYVKNIQEISLWQKWLVILSLWGIISCFIVIFFSDAKYHLISDYILWALFGFSFFLKLFYQSTEIMKQVENDIFSSLIVAFPIWLIYFLSKEKAMGLGDVYLAAILGFLLGWQKGFLALYLAFVLGGITGFFLILFGRKKLKSKIAFGPFLVIGALVMFFLGEGILQWVMRIYGL